MRRKQFVVDKISELEKVCRDQRIPLTIQRRYIMEALAERTDHPSAEQIHQMVSQRIEGVSLTTVYRVLEAFVRFGLARRVVDTGSRGRFDADQSSHHHAQCMKCGKIIDVRDPALEGFKVPAVQLEDFIIIESSIAYAGHCLRCGEGN